MSGQPDEQGGADGRLDAHIARVETREPPCRDCEVGEPHTCRLLATPSAPTGDHGGLRDVVAKLDAAHEEIVRMCNGGSWRMTVPVNEERDSDMILSNAIEAARAALAAHPEPEPAQDGEVGA